jgi:putative glutamine amidotransferase
VHDVKVAEGSRLSDALGTTTLSCASHHHQGVDRLAHELVPVAWSGDGLVEAAEHREGWLLAVQWHPELTAAQDPAQQALFDAFVERCRHRRRKRLAEPARPGASHLPGAGSRA